MSHNIFSALEFAVKQIAKANLSEAEYQHFTRGLKTTKHTQIGGSSVYDHLVSKATDIADWATNNKLQEYEDAVEREKQKVIADIKSRFRWR